MKMNGMVFRTILILMGVTFLIAGCGNPQDSADDKQSEKLVVYVSNYPLKYFVSRIAPPDTEIHFPASEVGDPAFWEPSPDSITAMQDADLVFLNGASYEQWRLNVTLNESSVIITTREVEGRLIDSGETITHSHGDEGEHAHSAKAFTTWLDLSLAIEQSREIKKEFQKLMPEQELYFEQQFIALSEDLAGMYEWFQRSYDKENFVVFSHPVYQYFQQAYGVNGTSVHWEVGKPLTTDQIHEIEHLNDHDKIAFMVWERTPHAEAVEQLKELGIESIVIDPMGGLPIEGDFLSRMQQNLNAWKSANGVE